MMESEQQAPRDLMTSDQAASYLQVAAITLRKWRCSGDGPTFLKIGRTVRYRKSDIDSYLEESQFSSTSAYPG